MGFRFHKSVSIVPGLRVNLSKTGLSTSVGGKGLTYNSRGRMTASIPGTGLSYITNTNKKAPTFKMSADKWEAAGQVALKVIEVAGKAFFVMMTVAGAVVVAVMGAVLKGSVKGGRKGSRKADWAGTW